MDQKLRSFYKNVLQITEDRTVALFMEKAEYLTVPRGVEFFGPEDTDHVVFFLVSGTARSYLMDEDGKDMTVRFAYRKGTLIKPSYSGIPGVSLYWEALSPVEMVCVPEKTLQEALQETSGGKKTMAPFPALLQEMVLGQLEEQRRLQMALVSLDATNRYQWFLKEYPDFPKSIPQKYVATYLNMLPQTLSQVRGGLKQKQTVKKPAKKVVIKPRKVTVKVRSSK